MAFSGVKKQKKNEFTVRSGSNPKKKGKRTLITFSKVKKNEKERTYRSVRSGTVHSALSVRPGSNPKKKGKRMLITFSKVKKSEKQKKGTNLPFRSLRNRSFSFVRSSGFQS